MLYPSMGCQGAARSTAYLHVRHLGCLLRRIADVGILCIHLVGAAQLLQDRPPLGPPAPAAQRRGGLQCQGGCRARRAFRQYGCFSEHNRLVQHAAPRQPTALHAPHMPSLRSLLDEIGG